MATPTLPDTADARSVKQEIYGIDISFTVLAVVAVGCRLWSRCLKLGSYGWDDTLIVISTFILFINLALNIVMIENGLGLQAADLDINNLIMIGKAIYGDEIVYVVNLALIKVAILVMYCRVFDLRGFRIGAWILGIITVIWSIMFCFICIFQCSPIPRAWDLHIPGKCLYLRGIFIGNAVPNISTDVIILAMPIYHVWKLQLRTIQRLGLLGIFLLGGFVVFASIYRFTTIHELDPMNLSYTLKTPTTWSHVEVAVALISACLPALRPVFRAFARTIGLSGHENTPPQNYNRNDAHDTNSNMQRGRKPKSDLSTFEILEDGDSRRQSWTAPSKNDSSDDVPLNVIRVTHDVDVSRSSGRRTAELCAEMGKRDRYPS